MLPDASKKSCINALPQGTAWEEVRVQQPGCKKCLTTTDASLTWFARVSTCSSVQQYLPSVSATSCGHTSCKQHRAFSHCF